jgi:hypothetical protein
VGQAARSQDSQTQVLPTASRSRALQSLGDLRLLSPLTVAVTDFAGVLERPPHGVVSQRTLKWILANSRL